jgi:hypothetical protein
MIRISARRAFSHVLNATCLTMAAAVPAIAMLAEDDAPPPPDDPASPSVSRYQTPDVTEIVRGTARPQPPVAVGDPAAQPRPTTTPGGVGVLHLALIALPMYAGFGSVRVREGLRYGV